MKTLLLSAAILMAPAALLAQGKFTPLDVKPGLWQTTTTMKVIGAPSAGQPRTTTLKTCLTQQELARDPFTEMTQRERNLSCKRDVLSSTAQDADVKMSCTDHGGNSSIFHLIYHAADPQHVTVSGTGSFSMDGRSMQSQWQIQSQWLQSSCPAQQH